MMNPARTRKFRQSRLRTTFKVVDALVKNGILPTKRAISPLNRRPYTAVPRSALETFMSEYGSLQGIARERGIHFMTLKKLLTTKGIEPALDRNRIPAAFYRRHEIPIDL